MSLKSYKPEQIVNLLQQVEVAMVAAAQRVKSAAVTDPGYLDVSQTMSGGCLPHPPPQP